MGKGFIEHLRADAANSLKGAIKAWRDEDFSKLVQDGEKHLREVFSAEMSGTLGPLNWKELAEKGGHPRLYNLHRMLSMASAHLTGLSLLRMIDDAADGPESGENRLNEASGSYNFAAMASTVALACRIQTQIFGTAKFDMPLNEIEAQLNEVAGELAPSV
jgi:hypothetical protein